MNSNVKEVQLVSEDVNQDNKYEMECIISEDSTQSINVNVKGITGSDATKAGYYLAIWQSGQAQSLSRAIAVQEIKYKADQKWSVTFGPGLDLANEQYVVALGTGWNSEWTAWSVGGTPDQRVEGAPMYYATTVLIEKGTGSQVYPNENPVEISILANSINTNSVGFSVAIPISNQPQNNAQYVVLREGKMDEFAFTPMGDYIKIENPQEQYKWEGRGPLKNGFNYTLVYLMGAIDNNPNLEAVVGWESFKVVL